MIIMSLLEIAPAKAFWRRVTDFIDRYKTAPVGWIGVDIVDSRLRGAYSYFKKGSVCKGCD